MLILTTGKKVKVVTEYLKKKKKQENLKRESVVTAILPSRIMEVSYYTSWFFRS